MANPEWPSTLPAPNADGYSVAPKTTVAESNMDDGYTLVRRRFIAVPTGVQVQWTLTTAQLKTFESFFRFTLLSGTLYFNTPLMNGKGINRIAAQFDQSSGVPYTYAPRPGSFDSFVVSATLRTLALPVDSP